MYQANTVHIINLFYVDQKKSGLEQYKNKHAKSFLVEDCFSYLIQNGLNVK